MISRMTTVIAILICLAMSLPASAIDDAQLKKGREATAKGIEFLRKMQNADGSWSPDPGPAITALVVAVLLDQPDIGPDDPAVKKGLAYILKHANEDGSIHGGIILNYNTSICLSTLARVRTNPQIAEVCKKGEAYLKKSQYDGEDKDENGNVINEDHAFFGGWGYGKHGRPDGSNTQFAVQALHDLGVDCNDPAFQKAMTYISRLQGGVEANDMHKDAIEPDGGSIYATSVNKDNIGKPQSMASPEQIERVKKGLAINNKLRTYGSMTYAMFKSYLYANLDRDDERVQNAFKWIQKNYTFDHNAGMPEKVKMQGYYYYLTTMSRAMDAYNKETITTADGKQRNWENDMVEAIVARQKKDGSWLNEADRWNEGDPNLVTAYALTALHHAMN